MRRRLILALVRGLPGIASLYRQPFELSGAAEIERRLVPDRVVEAVDGTGDDVLGRGLEDGAPGELGSPPPACAGAGFAGTSFNVLKTVRAMALSKQLPFLDIELIMPGLLGPA